jgi:hypothetical protein
MSLRFTASSYRRPRRAFEYVIVRLQLASFSPESKGKKIEDPLVLNLESVIPFKSQFNLDPGKLIKDGLSLPCKNEYVKYSTNPHGSNVFNPAECRLQTRRPNYDLKGGGGRLNVQGDTSEKFN